VSPGLAASIGAFTGQQYLYFFDAIAPVVAADSIDRSIVFPASRYGKGDGEDYLNCPMDADQYNAFIDALLAGELAPLHDFDKLPSDLPAKLPSQAAAKEGAAVKEDLSSIASAKVETPYFEGCLPIEVMAQRGRQTLAFGPMKPVGLTDPATGRRPHAVVQLRQDNLAAEHYSMVGFQTQLRWPEQTRIFRMIPGLAEAEFVRLGQVHRNCYINAPTVLEPDLSTRRRPELFFAGQISGVEGYTESAATGLLAGINAARRVLDQPTLRLPADTMLGALCHYISNADPDDYQPTNAAFGLLPPAPKGVRKKRDRKLARSSRALEALDAWITSGPRVLEGLAP